MQQVAYKLVIDPETKPSDVAQLMRAHVAAEQQRNILRMRPAPKPIDVSPKIRARKPSVVRPLEMPAEPPPAQSQSPSHG